jgi:type VI secretion system protein VasG
MKLIVELKLGRLARRLQDHQNLKVEFTKTVVKEIVSRCTRAETGARNIDAIIDRNIAPEVSTQLLGFMAEGKEPSLLKIGKDKKGNFTYNFT